MKKKTKLKINNVIAMMQKGRSMQEIRERYSAYYIDFALRIIKARNTAKITKHKEPKIKRLRDPKPNHRYELIVAAICNMVHPSYFKVSDDAFEKWKDELYKEGVAAT
jgi:hypothetical protein